jgi:hypothetical protein
MSMMTEETRSAALSRVPSSVLNPSWPSTDKSAVNHFRRASLTRITRPRSRLRLLWLPLGALLVVGFAALVVSERKSVCCS